MNKPTVSVESLKFNPNYCKCPRCQYWHTNKTSFGHLPEEIEKDPKLANEHLCDKCQEFLVNNFPGHPSVPYIQSILKESYDSKHFG